MRPPEARPEAALPLRFERVSLALGGETRLDDLACRIEAGGISVLLGPNGAGKSLFLALAAGLRAPTRGRLAWLGARHGEPRRAIVRQRPVLLRRSVRANLVYALRVRGVPRAAALERAEHALAATGLTGFSARAARSLSVGEQQRVALARAWATEPELLLLDEPAASLDPSATAALESLVRTLAAAGTKIVMATHDLTQARRMAADVLFLHRGRLLEQTAAAEFFREPRSVEAKKFLAGEMLS